MPKNAIEQHPRGKKQLQYMTQPIDGVKGSSWTFAGMDVDGCLLPGSVLNLPMSGGLRSAHDHGAGSSGHSSNLWSMSPAASRLSQWLHARLECCLEGWVSLCVCSSCCGASDVSLWGCRWYLTPGLCWILLYLPTTGCFPVSHANWYSLLFSVF